VQSFREKKRKEENALKVLGKI